MNTYVGQDAGSFGLSGSRKVATSEGLPHPGRADHKEET